MLPPVNLKDVKSGVLKSSRKPILVQKNLAY